MVTDSSIYAAQDFFDPINRNDMIDHPCNDDYPLQIYAYADGKDTSQIYLMQSLNDMETEVDMMVLYSPDPLPHAAYPRPAKSRPSPYSQTEVSLIAYHGDESRSIYMDYPTTPRQAITETLNSLNTDRLTIVKGFTGARNDPDLLFHRCSSAAGSSGGPLVNCNGEMVGMTMLFYTILIVGIHVEGEYRNGIVDHTCENVGIAFDSPRLRTFIRETVLPIVDPASRDAWESILDE